MLPVWVGVRKNLNITQTSSLPARIPALCSAAKIILKHKQPEG